MSSQKYHVFIPESELATMPPKVQIEETYPAFTIDRPWSKSHPGRGYRSGTGIPGC